MVNIDTVYQKVLAFANKEQRGYITPQEFSLFANQAQLEIFESYFHNIINQAKKPTNSHVYADVDQSLEERIRVFEQAYGSNAIINLPSTSNTFVKKLDPEIVYRVNRVEFDGVECELLNTNDFNAVKVAGPLMMPTNKRPVANVRGNKVRVLGDNSSLIMPTGIFYFKKPQKVSWGYFVVGNKALYDSSNSKTYHFELHPSEESELVYKILKFAGISMKQQDITQAGQGLETAQNQQ